MATAKKKAKPAKKSSVAKKATATRKPAVKASGRKGAAKPMRTAATDAATFHEYMTHGASVARTIKIEGAPRFFGAAEATSLSELTLLVQTRMNDGWIPAGGINVAAQGTFVQALIRY